MRIAVCDDNRIDLDMICEMLRIYFDETQLRPELVPYESGINLACDVEEGAAFDVVFLDIYMNNHLGIDTARRLRELGFEGEIVFLTASPDFAIDSYDVFAAGYILKPISPEKLGRVVEHITRNFSGRTYAIRQRSSAVRVPLSEIVYVESSNSKCILHRAGGSDYNVYKRLDEIDDELDDKRFLRCHQSYLVNMDYIDRVEREFILTTGEAVPIRQRNLKALREHYLEYTAERSAGAPADEEK